MRDICLNDWFWRIVRCCWFENFNDNWSLGTMSEIAIAYDRGIPVIGLNVDNQELHSWQVCMCERIFNNIDEMVDYIEDFYLR